MSVDEGVLAAIQALYDAALDETLWPRALQKLVEFTDSHRADALCIPPQTYVLIGGTSTGSGVTAGFSCRVPVEAGQFTVPSYILLGLPAGSGGVSIPQQDTVSTFSATGLDLAGTTGVIEYSVAATYK